jgi:hypothetical protein
MRSISYDEHHQRAIRRWHTPAVRLLHLARVQVARLCVVVELARGGEDEIFDTAAVEWCGPRIKHGLCDRKV